MKSARNGAFIMTIAVDGLVRLWTSDFGTLKSEVKTGTMVSSADISLDADQIAVMSQQAGTISLLDLTKSSYDVVMRSHLGQVSDAATSRITGKLVTISGEDYSIKIWDMETMEQLNEFVSENDKPCRIVC